MADKEVVSLNELNEWVGPFIEDLIHKYKGGLNPVWYSVDNDQVQIGPQTAMPVLKLTFGTRGMLLGPENYVWQFTYTDMLPRRDKIEQAVSQAMEKLREGKASQANANHSPFKGPRQQGPGQPGPQRMPGA